jgi:hypothetical protein
MVAKIKNIIIVAVCLMLAPLSLLAQAWTPTNGGTPGLKDKFSIRIKSGATSWSVAIEVNTIFGATQGKNDGQIDMNYAGMFCQFSTMVYTSDGSKFSHYNIDIRGKDEYDLKYFVDIPLWTVMAKDNATQYSLEQIWGKDKNGNPVNNAAVIIRLIDKQKPDLFINLLEGPYTFTSEAGEPDNRFIVRVYAGCVWKAGVTSGNWNDPANWHGGAVPGKAGNSDKINNCAFIPEGVNVTISEDITIGSIFNSGKITVNQGVTLTVKGDMKLIPSGDM